MKCKMLIGLPGSGKSTFRFQEAFEEYNIISSDDIIEEIADRYRIDYDFIFKDTIKLAQKISKLDFDEAVRRGNNIIIDKTNLTRKGRQKFLDLLAHYGYDVEAHVFLVHDNDEHLRRLNSRPGKTIPEDIILTMLSQFEMPTEAEGFSSITIHSS